MKASSQIKYGELNPHIIGYAMKEMVRRAIEIIRAQRMVFEQKAKESTYKEDGKNDLVTSADTEAQRSYVKMMREGFPDFGIVAEEDELQVPCSSPHGNIFFTVDPLDGTKAFGRRQSHGTSTMISLVRDGMVIAAYVGDINSQEVYGFKPESEKVWRISGFGQYERLVVNPERPLREQYALLRDAVEKHSPTIRDLVSLQKHLGAFKDAEIEGGSIGWGLARLWKGEVGGYVLRSGIQTPWDTAPIVGISRTLGFVFLHVDEVEGKRRFTPFTEDEYLIGTTPTRFERETVIVHESRVPELEKWAGGF